jgi:plasmid replication initiation protein
MLGVEGKYTRSSNFIEKVIKPSLSDINTHSNLNASFGVRKTGKRVSHIQFEFSIKNEIKQKIKEDKVLTLEQFVRDHPSKTKGKTEVEVRKMMVNTKNR